MRKKAASVIIIAGFLACVLTPVYAQRARKLPQVTLMPLEQEGDPAYCAPLAATVSDTLLLTLHLLGRYEIVRIPDSEWKSTGRDAVIDSYKINHIITGKVSAPAEGGVTLTFQVYNPEDETMSQELTISSRSYIGIFDITDSLMVKIVEEFTQEHFSYGSLSITNEGTAPDFWISLDGEEIGKNINHVSIVPAGSHQVKIYTKTDTEVNLADIYEIQMQEGEETLFTFTLDADQETAKEKSRKLSDGRTLNMTRVQWKEIWKSGQMTAPRVFQGLGIGLTIPGSLILSTGVGLLIAVAYNQNTLTETYGDDILKDIMNVLLYGGSALVAAIGAALTITGVIFWTASPVQRNKRLNKEFTLSAAPLLAPGGDGTLTAGISVKLKL